MFEPVARRTVADEVRERLATSIVTRELAPGEVLPSGDVLARRFGVSRASVREAIRELTAMGLVERRANRPRVVEQLPTVQLAPGERADRVRELFETRRTIELPLTGRAAERANAAQRAELGDLADRFAAVRTIDDLRPIDRRFHALVAASAGNSLLAELHAKVLDALFVSPRFDALLSGPHGPAEVDEIVAENVRAHTAIAAAVVAGDAKAAVAAAGAHLDEVERRLLERARRR